MNTDRSDLPGEEHPTVKAGGPLCGAALRETADWLDTYDDLAASYFDLLEQLGRATPDELASVRAAAAGKEQQADLRRWADELDAAHFDETAPRP